MVGSFSTINTKLLFLKYKLVIIAKNQESVFVANDIKDLPLKKNYGLPLLFQRLAIVEVNQFVTFSLMKKTMFNNYKTLIDSLFYPLF